LSVLFYKEYNLIDILMLSSGVYYQTTILNCRQPDAFRIRKCFYSVAQKIIFLNFPVPDSVAGSLSYNIISFI
jgi:hypothetical protein